MGNKVASSGNRKHVLDRDQLDEIMGGSSGSTRSARNQFRTGRSRSSFSTSSSTPATLQRKTSNVILAPPQSPRPSKLAERWDCDQCGCSNEGHLMVCFGCREIRC